MDLNEITVFIKVVELGSFSQAAKSLGMPNSTVSAKISELENRLGVSLMKRTTRKLFITPEGQKFFDSCRTGLEQIRSATSTIMGTKAEPHGLLRITAPISLGAALLPRVLSLYKEKYPAVQLEISLNDQTVDLISDGFDIALRAGDLKDSSLIAKKLGEVYFAPFASNKYLKNFGRPEAPEDLSKHCCLQFSNLGVGDWQLSSGKKIVQIPMTQKILINELTLLKTLAVDSAGIALLPTFLCLGEVRAGKLIRILPEWKAHSRIISFVYGGQKYIPSKVSSFIQLATESIKENLQNFEF